MENKSAPGSTQAPEPKISPDLAKELSEFFTRLAIFCSRDSAVCPYPDCKREVASMEKVGSCVYLRPCNHRLWNGEIPPAWKNQDE